MRSPAAALVVTGLLAACGGERGAGPSAPPPVASSPDGGALAVAVDPLGPRPELGEPAPYAPPVPVVFERPSGLRVWLLERHDVPMVSMELVVPAGAAHDPAGKAGLASVTASMLDEGAGKRGPLEIARDLDRLGATLSTGVHGDYAFAHLTVLTKNLGDALSIYGDVVARPRFDATEWRRVQDLWTNGLKARQSDPSAVASVVVARKAYPADHPYAHPAEGLLATAAKISLDDVKRFYASRWRPDRATCVVVGDIQRAELEGLLDKALAGWSGRGAPPAESGERAAFTGKDEKPPTSQRVFVVDRPDAPQSVIAVSRRGVSAFEEDAAGLGRVNVALGGSFTSRLNQDLREEHGWTYGAHTRFSFNRSRGLFVAEAAVQTEHTGEALKAMLTDVEGMRRGGLSEDEVQRTKKLARADLVEAYETSSRAASRLARYAGVGQAPDRDAVLARLSARADKATLDDLARRYLALDGAVVVIVGPRSKLEPQLGAIGITKLETATPEGD